MDGGKPALSLNPYFARWLHGGLSGCGAPEPTPSPLQGGERVQASVTNKRLAACDCHSLVHGLKVHPHLEVGTLHEPQVFWWHHPSPLNPVTHSCPLARPPGPSLLRIPSAASQAAEVPVGRGKRVEASRSLPHFRCKREMQVPVQSAKHQNLLTAPAT